MPAECRLPSAGRRDLLRDHLADQLLDLQEVGESALAQVGILGDHLKAPAGLRLAALGGVHDGDEQPGDLLKEVMVGRELLEELLIDAWLLQAKNCVFLGTEVVEEGARRDIGERGDLLHRDAVRTLFKRQPGRGVVQCRPGFIALTRAKGN